jgi:hypothetical protein
MAFKLDNDLLEELGLAALSNDDKQAMLRQILETLEMRVGTTLASNMTDEQLDEFERLMPTEGDSEQAIQQKEQQALQWLEANFPNYKQVVSNELDKLKGEIKQDAPHIVAASQQNAAPLAPPAQPSFGQGPADQSFGQAPPYPSQPTAAPAMPSQAPFTDQSPYPPQNPVQSFQEPMQAQPQAGPGFMPPTPPSQPAPYQPMPPTDNGQQGQQPYPPQAA